MGDLADENSKLKAQLAELQRQREAERAEYDSRVIAERAAAKQHAEAVQQRTAELESMKQNVVKLTRQLDDEVMRRDMVTQESQLLERRMQEMASGQGLVSPQHDRKSKHRGPEEEDQAARERGSHVSTKLMRVVDQWMRHRDLQQALLRGASINDQAFATLVQALGDCPSLHTVDLSQNLLTMDSCSDLCQLITTAPQLSFLSLADNLFSLRSLGYFMTAIMERQNTKKLMPLDLLDLSGNEGLVAAAAAPAPPALLRQVNSALGRDNTKLPAQGAELVVQVMRAIWRFLFDTGHPQVRGASSEDIAFQIMDKVTLRKMENSLMKIMLLSIDGSAEAGVRPVTANLALLSALDTGLMAQVSPEAQDSASPAPTSGTIFTPSGPKSAFASPSRGGVTAMSRDLGASNKEASASAPSLGTRNMQRPEAMDPFVDLKAAFEPPREKLKTFNLKQIVTRSGTVLMNMLERLLETTEIDAADVETEQTLLEYACVTGNMGLAKLCYRRGAKLSAKTRKGDTAFNIVTKARRYDLMEFLHMYGVKVNSCDANGLTALHCAAKNDDVDGICRLVEWGADVNIRDNQMRTPIHLAAAAGNAKATMLLLEVGADMNAKDAKLYTAAAHANFNSHFDLFDRLVALGGRRHGQIIAEDQRDSTKRSLGGLIVSPGMVKSSSLGRIGRISVAGMPGPLRPSPLSETKR